MKKQLYKAIAVVVFAAAMSITSCNKDILDPLTGETVEEGLALTPGAILKDYPGKTLIVHFTYGSVIRERVDFTFEAEGLHTVYRHGIPGRRLLCIPEWLLGSFPASRVEPRHESDNPPSHQPHG